MKTLRAENPTYELKEKLGEGLTSRVYRAYRVDSGGWTRHEVAIKILNSKKDIQIIKREFENLLGIHSQFCVKVLAMEILQGQPALVLEYVNGLSLEDLLKSKPFDPEMFYEILSQVHMGLCDLHLNGVCHGDLNLKNIMINQDGYVKLIDFGNEDPISGNQLMTREYASASRRAGNPVQPDDDFVSLKKLGAHLLGSQFKFHRLGKSSLRNRRKLVRWMKKGSYLSTQVVPLKMKKQARAPFKIFISTCLFFLALAFPGSENSGQSVQVSLRSDQWFRYSINELPFKYGPVRNLSLRSGKYRIVMENARGRRLYQDVLGGKQKIILQPPGKNLR